MRQRSVMVALVVLALLTVGLSAQVVLAQYGTTATGVSAQGTAAAGANMASTNVFNLAAGQSVTIPANFWCLDFAKPFPTGLTGPTGEAPARVQSVLQTAKAQGTVNSDPYQTQLAVWYITTGAWQDKGNAGHALAQQLVSAAGSGNAAGTAAASQNLSALMKNGGLTVNVQNFQAVQDKTGIAAYHGTGNIVVTNTSSKTVSFALDGAIFQPTNAGAQNLFAQTANNTVTAAATAAPTTAATSAATMAPTATTAPTATVAPTATTAPTTAPTVAATSTSVAVAATSTAIATPATLPTTGGGGSSGWMFVLLLLGALTLFAGFGLGARRAQR